MKKTGFVAGFAAVCLLFAGCSEHLVSHDVSKTSVITESEESCNHYQTANWAHTVTTKDGAYTADNIFSNSTNLFYTDFSTKQEVIFCPDPACAHNDETCQSWFENNRTFPLAIAKNETSLFIKDDSSEEKAPEIIQINMDGTNRRSILKLENGEWLGNTLAVNEDVLFCEINGTAGTSIVCVDLKNQKRETVYQSDEKDVTIQLIGGAGNKLLVLQYEESNPDLMKLYLLDPKQPVWDEPIAEASNEEGGFITCSGTEGQTDLYLNFRSKNEIHHINLDTGKKDVVQYQIPEGFFMQGMQQAYEQTLQLTFCSEDGNTDEYCLLDFTTGEQTEMKLRQTMRDYPVVVYGAWGDFLYVKRDSFEYTVKNTQSDGTVEDITFLGRKMALIFKDDYKNSVPNYQDIVSVVS